jgi:exopolysaccharide production protein ExoZ
MPRDNINPREVLHEGEASRKSGNERFNGLEAARGMAALCVVLDHGTLIMGQPRFYGELLWNGVFVPLGVAVDFFFVLSGFIIAWVHWNDIGKPARLYRYATRRFLRIYPPYWVVLLPLMILYFFNPGAGAPRQHDFPNVFFSITLLPYTESPILGAAWTLVREVLFYAVFALMILNRRMIWILPIWAVAIVVAKFFQPLSFPASIVLSDSNLQFLIGFSTAYVMRNYRIPAPRFFTILGCCCFFGFLYFNNFFVAHSLIGRLTFGLGAALGIMGIVEWERSHGLRVSRLLLILGAASYAIYLVHEVALSVGVHLLMIGAPKSIPLPLALSIIAGFSIVAGILFRRWVEKPLSLHLRSVSLRLPGYALAESSD